MREHKSEKLAPWHVLVPVENIAEAGQSFALTADAEIRGAIARITGLRDLPRLAADFVLTPQGSGGLHVVGRVSAIVGQNCVVTLEPLTNEVEEDVDLLFLPQSARIEEAGDSPADRNSDYPEPLIGGVIDLGALATEFLILGLDPYPRKPGAVFEPPRQERPEMGPFAALADLKGRQ